MSKPGSLNLLGDVLEFCNTQASINSALMDDVDRLWADNAALRDALHEATVALGNRIESLTRVVNARTENAA